MADEAAVYSAELNYLNEITADEITVIFNGTTYTVPKRIRILQNSDTHTYYGTLGLVNDGDATGEYPFCIYVAQGLNTVYVNSDVYHNHNPFTIKIVEESVTTTSCFDKARGYSCGEEMVTLTEESVTTAAQGNYNMGTLSYSQLINADSIKVTFDGVEYECPLTTVSGGYYYGGMSQSGPDFSEYPFVIGSEASKTGVTNFLVTETAGTYSVKIEGVEETITTTSCFQKAVESLTSPLRVTLTKEIQDATEESPTETPEGSQSNIINALDGGRMVYLVDPEGHKYLVIGYLTPAGLDPEIEVMDNAVGVVEFNADGSKFYYPQRQI